MNIRRAIFYILTLFASIIHIKVMSVEAPLAQDVMYRPEPLAPLFPEIELSKPPELDPMQESLVPKCGATALQSKKRGREDDLPSHNEVPPAGHKKQKLSTKPRRFAGERLYTCPRCNKSFTRNSDLTAHKRIHSGEKPFTCTICNKSFAQKSNLTAHKRIHSGEKPFTCTICNKSFTRNSDLTVHMRIHSGEKPFTCTICNESFAQKSNLKQHMRIHFGEKPFTCTICNESFARKRDLKQHTNIHNKE